jgi:ribosomal protein S12 methylthiotransferase accessory factor
MSVIAEYAQTLANFGALIDARTGIISSVDLVKISELDPAVFLAYAEPCDTTALAGIAAANRGAACSIRQERALVRACGESVERYCSAFFDLATMELASESELSACSLRSVSVRDVYPFTNQQFQEPGFPYQQVTPDQPIRWVRGMSLQSGEPVRLPASCVYVPYLFDVAVEPFTHMPISTGLAAGPSVEACIRKGILEILERDALMITWYSRMAVPRIDPASCYGISPQLDRMLVAAERCGSAWHLNLLTLDINVPIISAAMIDPGAKPLTSFGIAAAPEPSQALHLALEEALLTRVLLNRSREIVRDGDYAPGQIASLRDHLLAHATSPALRRSMHFLTDDGPLLRFDTLLDHHRDQAGGSVEARLAAAGYEAVWIDVTTPDVRDFGFRVVRTIVPGMQPLDNDHRYRHLGGKRLLSVPSTLGYPIYTHEDLNTEPHPFP